MYNVHITHGWIDYLTFPFPTIRNPQSLSNSFSLEFSSTFHVRSSIIIIITIGNIIHCHLPFTITTIIIKYYHYQHHYNYFDFFTLGKRQNTWVDSRHHHWTLNIKRLNSQSNFFCFSSSVTHRKPSYHFENCML